MSELPIRPTPPIGSPFADKNIESIEEMNAGDATASLEGPRPILKRKTEESLGLAPHDTVELESIDSDVPLVSKEEASAKSNIDESLIDPEKQYDEELQAGAVAGSLAGINRRIRSKDPEKQAISEKIAGAAGRESRVTSVELVTPEQVESQTGVAALFGKSEEFQSLFNKQIAEEFYVAVSRKSAAAEILDEPRGMVLTPADPGLLAGIPNIKIPLASEWVANGLPTVSSDKGNSFYPVFTMAA